jgi:hypothetical protein
LFCFGHVENYYRRGFSGCCATARIVLALSTYATT